MKSKLYRPPGLILKTGVMALLVMTLAWLPQANAAVTARTVIENVATVEWGDSSGNFGAADGYSDDAFTQVTINLVQAAVTISGKPIVGTPGTSVLPPTDQAVLAGTTATYLYAITANSNGWDTYNFRTPNTGADGHGYDSTGDVNVNATPTVSWRLMLPDGTTVDPSTGADEGSIILGSAIVQSVTSDTELVFPGGTVANFAVNDIVVINGIDFRISAISANNAPNHGTATTENQATITFAANTNGSNTTPLFTGATPVAAGDMVREQWLFRVTVDATLTDPALDGIVVHDVYLDTAVGANVATIPNTSTTFEPLPTVTISKQVRNLNDAVPTWGATATGNPGDILEYELTITNSGSTAEAVVVRDPVPAYTSLVRFSGSYGGGAPGGIGTDFFAQADNGAVAGGPVDLTVQDSDDELDTIASGDYDLSNVGELTFYVGDNSVNGSTATTGGDIPDGGTFTILYRVQIDDLP